MKKTPESIAKRLATIAARQPTEAELAARAKFGTHWLGKTRPSERSEKQIEVQRMRSRRGNSSRWKHLVDNVDNFVELLDQRHQET